MSTSSRTATASRAIFLVQGATGEYSDRHDWIARAFFTEAEARAEVLRLTELMQKLGCDHGADYHARDKAEEKMRAHDPKFSLDYTGSHYTVIEAELSRAASTAASDEMAERHRCFMDGIDWQHHLEGDARGTPLFPSENSLREVKTCLSGGCGVVEVEVRLIRWVEAQNLKFETVGDQS